jgi:tripartite-type tricarboxylate transporter receptor subunit TctC
MKASALVAAMLAAAAAVPASAQTWPAKPVRLVITFPAGSATDVWSRLIAERVSPRLGQNLIIENRPGAGGLVGAQHALAQPADGYTLLGVTPQMAIRTAAPKPPFDVRRDLAPIIWVTDTPFFLAVNAEKVPGAKTVNEVVEFVRARPGQLNMSHYGVGALGHLANELFMQSYGLRMVTVPYNGSVANAAALSRGDGHVTFDVYSSLRPHVEAGKVRIIAVATQARTPLVPDIPGMAEMGVANINVSSASGIAGPAGVPREVVLRLNREINTVIREPQVIETLARIGYGLVGGTPEDFRALLEKGVATWERVLKESNITLD